MGRTRIDLRGHRRLQKQLRTLRHETDDIVLDSLREWGEGVQTSARALAPNRTGRLRRNITVRVQARNQTATVGTHRGAFYGHLVENGTSHHAAQPFLGPAFRKQLGQVRRYVRTAVTKRLP